MNIKDIFIIGEIGINHNGDVEIAKKLIRMAKECGCDAVKFQNEILKLYILKMNLTRIEKVLGGQHKENKIGLLEKNTI